MTICTTNLQWSMREGRSAIIVGMVQWALPLQNEGTKGADALIHAMHASIIQDGYYYTVEEAGHGSHDVLIIALRWIL